MLLPQRYKFSSKSQLVRELFSLTYCCCCYRKGTNFQANHNKNSIGMVGFLLLLLPQRYKFSSKSQLRSERITREVGCCCYRKGTNFQANHNSSPPNLLHFLLLLLPQRYKFSSKSQPKRDGMNFLSVVVATAKVQIFKQITTTHDRLQYQ